MKLIILWPFVTLFIFSFLLPPRLEAQELLAELCYEPKKIGHCKGNFPRYFYNSTTGICEKFIFRGCSGNKNNFLTLQDCQDSCIYR